jgi:translation initiation factor IF-3
LRINQMIRIPQVRVVDEEGAQLGVMATPEALAMAQERGLDLVEVAPMASPPVVKFLDFGQYKYELTKREKEAKRKQRSVTFKEVRLKPKIGIGDFDTKVRRAIQFLEEGDRIKVAVQFRGRELTHPEIGRSLLARFSDQIKDHGAVERAPLLEGKSMHITVASTHKPKVTEHPAKHGHDDEELPVTVAPAGGPTAAADDGAGPLAEAAVPKTEATAPATEATAPATKVTAPTAEATAPTAEVTAPATRTPEKPAEPVERPAEPVEPTAIQATPVKTKPHAHSRPAVAPAETAKPAPRAARTRKTSEPEAPAPAPAGE